MTEPGAGALDLCLAEIARLELPALRAAWVGLFGRPPPKGLSRRLLEYAAAYHEQTAMHGGLKPSLRRRLRQGAQPGPADRRRPDPHGALAPGTRLVREWHGRSYTVEVAERGFLFAGRQYRSL